jgi:phage-related tail fiber protein
VLVKNQANPATNGIYIVAAIVGPVPGPADPGLWVRATDADAASELVPGMTVPVTAGTANGGKTFVMSTNTFPTVVRTLKVAADVATTGPILLTGEQTIDSVLTSASRVLVKNQADSSKNGLYTSGAGAWTRTADANSAAALASGMAVPVTGGTIGTGLTFIMTAAASPTVVDTTPLTFSVTDNTTQLAFAVQSAPALPAIYAEDYNFPGAERAMAVDTFKHSVN